MVAIDLDAAIEDALGEDWAEKGAVAAAGEKAHVVRTPTFRRPPRPAPLKLSKKRTRPGSLGGRFGGPHQQHGGKHKNQAKNTSVVAAIAASLDTIEEGDAETATRSVCSSTRARSIHCGDSVSCGGSSHGTFGTNGANGDPCVVFFGSRFGDSDDDDDDEDDDENVDKKPHFLDQVAGRSMVDMLREQHAELLQQELQQQEQAKQERQNRHRRSYRNQNQNHNSQDPSETSETDCCSDIENHLIEEQSSPSLYEDGPTSSTENYKDISASATTCSTTGSTSSPSRSGTKRDVDGSFPSSTSSSTNSASYETWKQQAQSRKRRCIGIVIGLVLLVGAAATAVALLLGNGGSDSDNSTSLPSTTATNPGVAAPVVNSSSTSEGVATAPVAQTLSTTAPTVAATSTYAPTTAATANPDTLVDFGEGTVPEESTSTAAPTLAPTVVAADTAATQAAAATLAATTIAPTPPSILLSTDTLDNATAVDISTAPPTTTSTAVPATTTGTTVPVTPNDQIEPILINSGGLGVITFGPSSTGSTDSINPAATRSWISDYDLESYVIGTSFTLDECANANQTISSTSTATAILQDGSSITNNITSEDAFALAPLYCSERWFEGIDGGGYDIPVPVGSGPYIITLHFAELVHELPAQRVFDVSIEDQVVFASYDAFVAAGNAAWTATTIVSTVPTVPDGVVSIRLTPVIGNANICAVEIVPVV